MSPRKWLPTIMTSSEKNHIENGDLIVEGRLIDASNATLYGHIRTDTETVAVIYKPIAGERPLWDFPDGNLAQRELAAFRISEVMQIGRVPFTIIREGPFGPGMVQQWINTDDSVDLISFSRSDDVQLRELALFDAIINNTDRKIGHLLVDKSGFLYGCDHGVTFHAEDKLRTVLWQWRGTELSEHDRSLINRVRSADVSALLSELITEEETVALMGRVERLITSNQFPQPSQDWPAIPWPPV